MSFMIKDAMLGLYHSTVGQYNFLYMLIKASCLFSASAGPSIPTFSVSLLKIPPLTLSLVSHLLDPFTWCTLAIQTVHITQ